MKRNRRINRRIMILGFITISFLLCTGVFCEMTFAQGGEQAVSQVLSSYGLDRIDVSFSKNRTLVKYLQPLAEFKTLDEEAIRVAEITQIVSSRLATEKNVCIHQHFDDGQIIELTIELTRWALDGTYFSTQPFSFACGFSGAQTSLE